MVYIDTANIIDYYYLLLTGKIIAIRFQCDLLFFGYSNSNIIIIMTSTFDDDDFVCVVVSFEDDDDDNNNNSCLFQVSKNVHFIFINIDFVGFPYTTIVVV